MLKCVCVCECVCLFFLFFLICSVYSLFMLTKYHFVTFGQANDCHCDDARPWTFYWINERMKLNERLTLQCTLFSTIVYKKYRMAFYFYTFQKKMKKRRKKTQYTYLKEKHPVCGNVRYGCCCVFYLYKCVFYFIFSWIFFSFVVVCVYICVNAQYFFISIYTPP